MPAPRIPLEESLRFDTPPVTIYCPACNRWFTAGTRGVAERLFREHLDEVRDPDDHGAVPF